MVALQAPKEPLTDGVVFLRRFTLDDVPTVTRACQDPEIARWTASIPAPYEEHHARTWIGLHDRFWGEEQRATFAFCAASMSELLGCMTLGEIDFGERSAAVGYWAAPWARNRGATTRALRLVCRRGFESLGIDRVDLSTVTGNVASERVAEKGGFTLVGTDDDYKPLRAIDPEARFRVKHWMLRRGSREPGGAGGTRGH
jgi:RimJ/RimL family protein N-acetyltransferase